MIELDVPGRQIYHLEHLVLDLNGTISLDGNVIEGVAERLAVLRGLVGITVVTADTRGTADELALSLRVQLQKVDPGHEQVQKLKLVQQLGSQATVSVGNGSNDAFMLRESLLGICVLGPEGTSAEAIAACDLVAPDINAALDLLIKPERLIATLRK